MNRLHPDMHMLFFLKTNLIKRYGWYGMAFFFIKGLLWLLTPLLLYTTQ